MYDYCVIAKRSSVVLLCLRQVSTEYQYIIDLFVFISSIYMMDSLCAYTAFFNASAPKLYIAG